MNNTRQTLGVFSQYGLGEAWPELKVLLTRLYTDRVAKLPWVPRDWFVQVQALQSADSSSLIVIGPAVTAVLGRDPDAPVFADSEAKLDAWQDLFKMVQAAVNAYAAREALKGRVLMEAAYSNSEFWNSAYSIAVAIRDLPANAVKAVLDGAEGVAGGVLKNLFKSWITWAVLAGVGLIAAWKFGLLKFPRK